MIKVEEERRFGESTNNQKEGRERARTLTHPPTSETGDPTGEKGRGVSEKGTARRGEKISHPQGSEKIFPPSSPPVFLQNPAGHAARLPHTSVRGSSSLMAVVRLVPQYAGGGSPSDPRVPKPD
jgi:hypothetical protein